MPRRIETVKIQEEQQRTDILIIFLINLSFTFGKYIM